MEQVVSEDPLEECLEPGREVTQVLKRVLANIKIQQCG